VGSLIWCGPQYEPEKQSALHAPRFSFLRPVQNIQLSQMQQEKMLNVSCFPKITSIRSDLFFGIKDKPATTK
jgi:hypothetical protein